MSNNENMFNFTNVDKSSNNNFFIKSIDNYSALDIIKNYKQRTINIQNIGNGMRILDVGCGTGEDIVTIASIIGEQGLAFGVDFSNNLLAEADKRHSEKWTNIRFKFSDAHNLEFENEFFDCCRADLVFHFLKNPAKALSEMIRVTKKGGSVLVVNADFDSLLIDSDDTDLTRKIVHFRSDLINNGGVSRQLYRMFKEHGLKNIILEPITIVVTKLKFALMLFDLENVVNLMIDEGSLAKSLGIAWINDLKEKDNRDIFFSSITGFIVAGEK